MKVLNLEMVLKYQGAQLYAQPRDHHVRVCTALRPPMFACANKIPAKTVREANSIHSLETTNVRVRKQDVLKVSEKPKVLTASRSPMFACAG